MRPTANTQDGGRARDRCQPVISMKPLDIFKEMTGHHPAVFLETEPGSKTVGPSGDVTCSNRRLIQQL